MVCVCVCVHVCCTRYFPPVSDVAKPDGETRSTATDEPDVSNWDKCCTRCFPPVSESDYNLSCRWKNNII